MSRKNSPVAYFMKNVSAIVGLVLIWRGIWYTLDSIDLVLFGGVHLWTAVGGALAGFLVLYIPDRNLKEIENL